MTSSNADQDRYTALASVLTGAGAACTPAEAHGVTCAALCAGLPCSAMDRWLPHLGMEAASGQEAGERARRALAALCELAHDSLSGEQFSFEPLLPGDAASVDTRAEAIADWCRGFLFALLDLGAHDIDRLPGDAGEIARDMMAMSELESGQGEDESSQRALEELREYLRVGVQLIYEELRDARDGAGTSS